MLDWARMSGPSRQSFLMRNADWLPKNARPWNPLIVRKNPTRIAPMVIEPNLSSGALKQFHRRALEDVSLTMARMQTLRDGLGVAPPGGLRYTPRFAFELSALTTQIVATAVTYGEGEAWSFLSETMDDPAPYNRFFGEVIHRFLTRGGTEKASLDNLDLVTLSALCFWCMTGTARDGTRSSPSARLFSVLGAADDDWWQVFPLGMSTLELIDHWDKQMGVIPWRRSLELTQQLLEDDVGKALDWLSQAGTEGVNGVTQDALKVFRAVLDRRRLLIDAVMQEPMDYIVPERWMRDLSRWPQCPVHLKYSPGKFGRSKADFAHFGPGAQFNLATDFSYVDGTAADQADVCDRVGDVFIPSFFPGGFDIPLESIVRMQTFALVVDVLMDPAQVTWRDEKKIRTFVRDEHRKHLFRLI
jgi:hypothetical protein